MCVIISLARSFLERSDGKRHVFNRETQERQKIIISDLFIALRFSAVALYFWFILIPIPSIDDELRVRSGMIVKKNNILIRNFSHLSTTTTTTNHRLAINKFSIAMVRTDQFFPLLCAHKLWISKVISDSLRSAWKVEHTDNLIFLHTSFAGFEQIFFAPLSRFLFYEVLRSNINWEIEKRPADFSFVPFYWD